MLEVINLRKVYSTKGGATVNALDGVSLRFPETGMVFLLGKSGSGKSTLLNVCGGLDTPTDGEIIVKGRSSKDFTQSDFDSYRNTYVGFIFQEYNILNEFTVEDNIALALELQGKPKNRSEIQKLLEEVDLGDMGRRKPNTLSGGQKQRIAIARALIKSPEIIMADEPTGALDSGTGKQVFDTLKKLSKTKLVIVVSHDRDFAELYGDRIIELADGKVISDVSKAEVAQSSLNDKVSVIGDSVLCVNGGCELTDGDFEHIKTFLRKNKNAIICTDEQDLTEVRRAAKINEEGRKEVFRKTEQPEKKSYSPDSAKFIRSKLPAKHAFKIGASGMKSKPVRLIFTTLLCTVAFVLFGLLSTMMLYNADAVFTESMMNSDFSLVAANKKYTVINKIYEGGALRNEYEFHQDTRFTAEDIAQLSEIYGKDTFGAIGTNSTVSNISLKYASTYYQPSIINIAYLAEDNTLRDSILHGRYPTADNEMLITAYTADVLVKLGLFDPVTEEDYEVSARDGLVGKTLSMRGEDFVICGIIDCGSLPEKYDALKDGTSNDWSLDYSFREELQGGIYQTAFLSKSATESYAGEMSKEDIYRVFSGTGYIGLPASLDTGDPNATEWYQGLGYGKYDEEQKLFGIVRVGGKTGPLADNEIIISAQLFSNYFQSYLSVTDNEAYQRWSSDTVDPVTGIATAPSLSSKLYYAVGMYDGDSLFESLTKEQCLADAIDFIEDYFTEGFSLNAGYFSYELGDLELAGCKRAVNAVGFFYCDDNAVDHGVLVSDKLFSDLNDFHKTYAVSQGQHYFEEVTDYVVPDGAIYSTAFLEYDRSREATEALAQLVDGKRLEDNGILTINNMLVNQIKTTNSMVETMSEVFLYVGLVMAVFAALLLSNFISVSISQKTREIGILRAVGARSLDVFKIFFSEAFIISAICVVLSTAGGIAVCAILNSEVASLLGGVNLFVFGPVSIAMLLGVAAITAVVATFLPVWRAARRKPVESIKAL